MGVEPRHIGTALRSRRRQSVRERRVLALSPMPAIAAGHRAVTLHARLVNHAKRQASVRSRRQGGGPSRAASSSGERIDAKVEPASATSPPRR